jgi:hypothetical protein
MFLFNPDESPSILTYGQFLRRGAGVIFCRGLDPPTCLSSGATAVGGRNPPGL